MTQLIVNGFVLIATLAAIAETAVFYSVGYFNPVSCLIAVCGVLVSSLLVYKMVRYGA